MIRNAFIDPPFTSEQVKSFTTEISTNGEFFAGDDVVIWYAGNSLKIMYKVTK